MFRKITTILILLAIFTACQKEYLPKPRGYYRIDFPQKSYTQLGLNLPYMFELPVYSYSTFDEYYSAEPYWINIKIPENKATFHITYRKINGNLDKLTEDSHKLTYEHTVKASAINERIYIDTENKVYGTIFEIKGNAASPMQFHLTDSVSNFVRGAVYISETPNYDSLRPVIQFLEEDIYHLINTFAWRENATDPSKH